MENPPPRGWGHGYHRAANEPYDLILAMFSPDLRYPVADLIQRCSRQRVPGWAELEAGQVWLEAGEMVFGIESFARRHAISDAASRCLRDKLTRLGWFGWRPAQVMRKSNQAQQQAQRRLTRRPPSVLRLLKWREILWTTSNHAGMPTGTTQAQPQGLTIEQENNCGARTRETSPTTIPIPMSCPRTAHDVLEYLRALASPGAYDRTAATTGEAGLQPGPPHAVDDSQLSLPLAETDAEHQAATVREWLARWRPGGADGEH